MLNSRWKAFSLILIIILLLAGCSSTGQAPPAGSGDPDAASPSANTEKEQIELSIFKYGGVTLTQTEVDLYISQPLAKTYPHIKVKLIDVPEGSEIEPLLLKGIIPDIIFGGGYAELKEKDLIEDLAPYKQKYGYDTSRLKPEVVEALEITSEGNQFPFSINLPVLYINKDIFDKFGVPYINDVKTWDEILDIAKKLTKADSGVNYIGIDLTPSRVAAGLTLSQIDPKTGKANVTSPDWVRVFEVLRKQYEIPGFVTADGKYQYIDKDDIFYNERNIAIYPHNLAQLIGPLEELRKQGITMNWDFAPSPNFADELGNSSTINVHRFSISKGSKHKDEAYQVLNLLLSDEVQRIITRNGRVSVLNDPSLEEEYGADIEVLKGKTLENIFKTKPRHAKPTHIYESKASKHINEAAKSVALQGVDINTALRIAQEKIDKELETLAKTQ